MGSFAEAFVLRRLQRRKSLLADVDARFDSADVSHRTRRELPNPSPRAAKDYVRRAGDDMISVLQNNEGLDSTDHYVACTISHHDAHCEAFTYTRQTLDWGDATLLRRSRLLSSPSSWMQPASATTDSGHQRARCGATKSTPPSPTSGDGEQTVGSGAPSPPGVPSTPPLIHMSWHKTSRHTRRHGAVHRAPEPLGQQQTTNRADHDGERCADQYRPSPPTPWRSAPASPS